MEILYKFIANVGPFFLLLGILIFVHELGHFLVAKFFGVRVETFSLGFGKKILKYKKGDTTYCVSVIPLGGYVKMFGDDPTKEISEPEKAYSFLHKPLFPRFAIVLAGPLMNLFFAVFLFAWLGAVGEPVPGTTLGDIETGTTAYAAGFRSGDTVVKVDGATYAQWKPVKEYIETHPNQAVAFEVRHQGSNESHIVTATPTLEDNPFIFTSRREIGWIEGLNLESLAPLVAITDATSVAAKAGLKTFDQIQKINGKELSYWRDLPARLAQAATEDQTVKLTVTNRKDKDAQERVVEIASVDVPKVTENSGDDSLLAALGIASPELTLFSIKPDSPAEHAGLKDGDRIVAINGVATTKWQQLLDAVKNFKPEQKALDLKIHRTTGDVDVVLAPELTEIPTPQGSVEQRFAIGVSPAILTVQNPSVTVKVSGFFPILGHGIVKSWEWTKLISISLVRLAQNEVSARNIGGVISIGRVASQSYEMGWSPFFNMMAIISINLFLLNLLPIPVLDGGHLVFFTIEGLKGSPLSLRKMEMAQQVGLVLLLSLMVFALFNDISHWVSPPW